MTVKGGGRPLARDHRACGNDDGRGGGGAAAGAAIVRGSVVRDLLLCGSGIALAVVVIGALLFNCCGGVGCC